MKRIEVPGKLYFVFNIRTRLIDKLKQGRDIYSDSTSYERIYVEETEIPVAQLALKPEDPTIAILPPLEIHAKVKLTLKRDKRKSRGRKR